MNPCAICGVTMTQVPAGISKKTGRPYTSFLACPNKHQQPRPGPNPYSPAPAAPITREPVEAPDWDKIAEGKVRNAVVTSQIQYGGIESLKGKLPAIKSVVGYIMTGAYTEE